MSTMEKEQSSARIRRLFTKEFKRDAVSLVIDEGRRIVDVATSLGIGDATLGNWVTQARVDRGERDGLTTSDKTELARLCRDNARLWMERDVLKRATAFSVTEPGQQPVTSNQLHVTCYEWVVGRRAEGFPTIMACDAAEVSRQGFYDWQKRVANGPTDAQRAETVLVAEMREIHDDFDGTYGAPYDR